MSKILFATALPLSLAIAGAAFAQTAPATTTPAPAQPAQGEHAQHPTIESSIEALLGDPATKAVVEKHLPGIDRHPAYSQFKSMTLRQVAPYSQGHITPEKITAIDTDLKALPSH